MPLSIKPYFSYLDKSFKDSHTREYIMAMQLNLHGLTFFLFNPEKNKFLGLEAYQFDETKTPDDIPGLFDLILNHHEWFAYPYLEFYFLMQNNYNTLIPDPLFDKKNKNLFLGFNQPFRENHRIVFDHLKNSQTTNVYYLANPIAEKVKEFWPNAHIFHYSSALIESLSVNYKNKMDPNKLFIDCHEDNFDLVYFKENRLFYFNNFNYRTKEDFIYFLLSAIEQLMLNPEEVELIIMGQMDKTSPEYEMIYQYIRHSSFIDRNENFHYSYVLEEVKHYKFYTLYNLLQCEL